MATTEEYDKAREAVKAGNATSHQLELVRREAAQAGRRGNAARAALHNED